MIAINVGYYFEDLQIGMASSFSRVISQDDISSFAKITGDDNPIHINEEWASATRFGGRIAHGMLTASLISTVIGTKMPGPGNIYLKQDLEFRNPVRPGDAITTEVTVIDLDPTKNRVRLETICRCGETVVLKGEALLRVHSRNEPL